MEEAFIMRADWQWHQQPLPDLELKPVWNFFEVIIPNVKSPSDFMVRAWTAKGSFDSDVLKDFIAANFESRSFWWEIKYLIFFSLSKILFSFKLIAH